MIPIQDVRKAFYLAVNALHNEIDEIERSLKEDNLTEAGYELLKKRISELKKDLAVLEAHEMHC